MLVAVLPKSRIAVLLVVHTAGNLTRNFGDPSLLENHRGHIWLRTSTSPLLLLLLKLLLLAFGICVD